ncbi:DUF2541 domain-containing protein [Flavobacterium sp. AG291]|uniref:DUF2541 domain-containing protein n=1 Tax=Flavobacterium sp. AG291 TaxID=2184000 RepID=UPI000E0BFF62|nr:DUF2541 domain-containing protein [Flavobacterium sp. AG291]RDI11841.1 hypothetical protein DEU42_1053 [Flavobacterium sp. AG291]
MKNTFTLLTFFLFLGFSSEISAQNWVTIAEKTVSFKAEKDVVTPRGDAKSVDKIRIKCVQGTVKLKKVYVEMSDGTKKEYDAKAVGVLTKGMTSLAWDLPGKSGSAKIKKIELQYDSVGNMLLTDKAKVEVQGRTSK